MTTPRSTNTLHGRTVHGCSARVCAVILSYNGACSLKSVIAAVRQQSYPVTRLIVVDNGSTDGTVAYLKESCRDCELILLPENIGVGAGHNRGWSAALGDAAPEFIWSLEHDSVPEHDCLEKLLEAYRARAAFENIGAVSASTVAPSDSGRDVRVLRFWRLWRSETISIPARTSAPFFVRNFTFNGTLFPVEVIQSGGRLNESFFVGYEDLEFAYRILDSGRRILKVPAGVVFHDDYKTYTRCGSSDTGMLFIDDSVSRSYYARRNALYVDRVRKGTVRTALRACARLPVIWANTLFLRDQKTRRLQADWFSFRDGILGYLGRKSYGFLNS